MRRRVPLRLPSWLRTVLAVAAAALLTPLPVHGAPMSLYRKKPVVIEARQFKNPVDIGELARWCGGEWRFESHPTEHAPQIILIPTLEGTMTAHPGDWIIKGVKGEFYPCKPDIFEATYEAAEATS